MPQQSSILVLGAGELGLAVLQGFANRSEPHTELTVLLRPETANLPRQAPKVAPIYALPGDVKILPCDLASSSQAELMEAFKPFDTIIGCTGYANNEAGNNESLQIKIARAVLATESVRLYVPWQFGVDYDAFKRGDAGGLFDDQKDVRDLLRLSVDSGQSQTDWIIVSTGIFMSYLFQEFWGVVQRDSKTEGWVVNALGGWEYAVTVTTAQDIGRLTADIVSAALLEQENASSGGGRALLNRPIFIAGDTVKYVDLVDIVAKATGKPSRRGKLLESQSLVKIMDDDPGDVLNKYRVAFARNDGVAWDVSSTFNGQKGIPVTDARTWAEKNLR